MESVINSLNSAMSIVKDAMGALGQQGTEVGPRAQSTSTFNQGGFTEEPGIDITQGGNPVLPIENIGNTAGSPVSYSSHPLPPELADVPYNQLQQVSSHNSYSTEIHGDQTIAQQFEEFGIHSFELDIHTGDAGGPGSDILGDDKIDGDYHVYHDSADQQPLVENAPIVGPVLGPVVDFVAGTQGFGSGTNNPTLSHGLNEIYNLENEMPFTLFVDVKDPLTGQQDPAALNALLNDGLQEKIFTPQDLMEWAGTDNLQDAVANGWPTAEELDGRVIVVLTGENAKLDDYIGADGNPAAFIAPSPDVREWDYIQLDGDNVDILPAEQPFTPNPDAIFYNTNDPGHAEIVHDEGYTTRVWDFHQPDGNAKDSGANHLGTDAINPDNNGYPESPTDTDPFNVLDPPPDNPDSNEEISYA